MSRASSSERLPGDTLGPLRWGALHDHEVRPTGPEPVAPRAVERRAAGSGGRFSVGLLEHGQATRGHRLRAGRRARADHRRAADTRLVRALVEGARLEPVDAGTSRPGAQLRELLQQRALLRAVREDGQRRMDRALLRLGDFDRAAHFTVLRHGPRQTRARAGFRRGVGRRALAGELPRDGWVAYLRRAEK